MPRRIVILGVDGGGGPGDPGGGDPGGGDPGGGITPPGGPPASPGICTLAGIRAAVQARGFGTDTANAQTTVINDVYSDLAGDHAWDWLEARNTSIVTAIGTSGYALSGITDLVTLQEVRLLAGNESWDLNYMDPVELESRLYIDLVNDTPTHWTRRNNQLVLYPRPNRVFNLAVEYVRDPPSLVNDTDSPVFPPTFCPVLVYGALAELAARHRDWAMSDRYRARYEKLVSRMKSRAGVQEQQTSRQVRRSGFYGC